MLFFTLACDAPDPDAPTWNEDVAPIVTESCASCHYEGGIAPFALTTWQEVAERADEVAASVSAGTMPPWPPDPTCREYQDSRALSDDERATLLAWVEAGAPEGVGEVAADAPIAAGLSKIDLTLAMPEPYTPQVEPDDYRCFLLEWPEATAYVTGFAARPGNDAVVHHVIAYAIPPEEAEDFRALDAAEEGPGYTCFGGPGGETLSRATWIGGWAPGGTGNDFPDGTGIAVEEGSLVALQLHYNTAAAGPLEDQTSIDLSVAESVASPATILKLADPQWVAGGTMRIAAGDPAATASFTTPSAVNGGRLWAAALHMHELGSTARLVLDHDGTEECLLDIPAWDFDWQGSYGFTEAVTVDPGDTLTLSCQWDNSGGTEDVYWGEGTGDEMCLGVLYATAE